MSEGDEADCPRRPASRAFVVMELLLERLKLLNYEEEVVARHNLKPLNRHYFVASRYLPSDPDEQFHMFRVIAAWLINAAGRSFPAPQENDDPTATASNILAELRALGGKGNFPPTNLLQGSGECVCFVLYQLAEKALKKRGFSFKRPTHARESTEDEFMMEDKAELTFDNEEDETSDDEEEDEMDQEAVDPAEWALEVERVLPQLTAPIETDNKDWRSHVDQLHQHRDRIYSSLEQTMSFLHKLQEDISSNMKKLSSREESINFQLKHLIQEYRDGQAKMRDASEQYEKANGRMMDRTRVVAEVNDSLRKVKKQMEEKGSSMSDEAPVVKINQSLVKLNQEIAEMDVTISVLQHLLLQAKLREKHNMMCDMYATNIPDAAAEPFSPS
ncbi:intraflagellar transport protein 57 homolog [Hippoglossus hippoglossus]|uniref:intraflagellar transport protein 57 homolog n=1 Tax=Hippoglossus hippoglossus TaxID=8267 RepID=UPI00148B539B|nr:intraflagellar transport protein 57 homolog [Hippoglossus hippoglossus]